MVVKKVGIDPNKTSESQVVDNLVTNGEDFPEGIYNVFSGYLGKNWKAPQDTSKWRLYNSPDLNEFIEFDYAKVAYLEDNGSSNNPLSRVTIWLESDAEVSFVSRTIDKRVMRYGGFLAGEIVEAFLSGRSGPPTLASIGRRLFGTPPPGSPGCGSQVGTDCIG
jgi:hypothetical protein